MSYFVFEGTVEASKSLMNRWLVIQSFAPAKVLINGDSSCDDVVFMRRALSALEKGAAVECGMAGTVLRFCAFRASRLKGEWVLKGERRLFERPQTELVELLQALGAEARLHESSLHIRSSGEWAASRLNLNLQNSSQFASGLLLSAWALPFALKLELSEKRVSDSYLELTRKVLTQAGMKIIVDSNTWHIEAGQQVKKLNIQVEADLSSAFALAAAAVNGGELTLYGISFEAGQGDARFVDLLEQMGADVKLKNSHLVAKRTQNLASLDVDLSSTPDLFPVLAVLCARAQGVSHLGGAHHLRYKESNRIAKTEELLAKLGVRFESRIDGINIVGRGKDFAALPPFTFDCDQDHRLAMAAGVAIKAGAQVSVIGAASVEKSFPGFWKAIGESRRGNN